MNRRNKKLQLDLELDVYGGKLVSSCKHTTVDTRSSTDQDLDDKQSGIQCLLIRQLPRVRRSTWGGPP